MKCVTLEPPRSASAVPGDECEHCRGGWHPQGLGPLSPGSGIERCMLGRVQAQREGEYGCVGGDSCWSFWDKVGDRQQGGWHERPDTGNPSWCLKTELFLDNEGSPGGLLGTGREERWAVVRMEFQRLTLVVTGLAELKEDNSKAGRPGGSGLRPMRQHSGLTSDRRGQNADGALELQVNSFGSVSPHGG